MNRRNRNAVVNIEKQGDIQYSEAEQSQAMQINHQQILKMMEADLISYSAAKDLASTPINPMEVTRKGRDSVDLEMGELANSI